MTVKDKMDIKNQIPKMFRKSQFSGKKTDHRFKIYFLLEKMSFSEEAEEAWTII